MTAARILVVSPIPSHPPTQGNSARINALGHALQSAGLLVHFLYYQLEGITPSRLAAMQSCWDALHLVPVSPRSMAPTGGNCHALDDWWDPVVSEVAVALHRRWRFQAIITNYVWFSAVLDAFSDSVLRILDTHDVFGGRDRLFRDMGTKPEWYYTSAAEEARGLRRADIVLAIQGEEAAQLRKLGHGDVRVVGHLLGQRCRAPREVSGRGQRFGYLASANPINLACFASLLHGLRGLPRSRHEFVVAGSICGKLEGDQSPFTVSGEVDDVDTFYDGVDVVLNPMAHGTGLKIKSVEAVFEGLPLIATREAMIGLPARHRLHQLAGPEEVATCLRSEDFSAPLLALLRQASRECAAVYARETRLAIVDLVRAIEGRPGAGRRT